jgi:hypothetical protein
LVSLVSFRIPSIVTRAVFGASVYRARPPCQVQLFIKLFHFDTDVMHAEQPPAPLVKGEVCVPENVLGG